MYVERCHVFRVAGGRLQSFLDAKDLNSFRSYVSHHSIMHVRVWHHWTLDVHVFEIFILENSLETMLNWFGIILRCTVVLPCQVLVNLKLSWVIELHHVVFEFMF